MMPSCGGEEDAALGSPWLGNWAALKKELRDQFLPRNAQCLVVGLWCFEKVANERLLSGLRQGVQFVVAGY